MANYSIDDAHGNQIRGGLPAHAARRTAQRLADERDEVVLLYSADDGEEDDGEEFAPTEIEATLDGPSGPRVRYGAQDAGAVEAEVPEGWIVDWADAVSLAASATDVIRYAAPLVRRPSLEYQGRLVILRPDADTDHQEVDDWYDGLGYSIGWYREDGNEGEVVHPACTIEQLDALSDAAIVAAECPPGASDEERDAHESAVEYARLALDAARACVDALERAVLAYAAHDLRGVIVALDEARSAELEYGDSPAADALASALLADAEE